MNDKQFIKKIESLHYKLEFKKKYVLHNLLNLIFWKDYKESLIKTEEKYEIDDILEKAEERGGDESYIVWDTDRGMKLANTIRKRIGLPEIERKNGAILVKEEN